MKQPASTPDNGVWMQAVYNKLLEGIAPDYTTFCEIYNLWIEPSYRRKAIASKLKQALESYMSEMWVNLIFTRTEKENTPVIKLNQKLKYTILKQNILLEHICFLKKL